PPPAVTRLPARRSRRRRTGCGRDLLARTSKRSCTALATLLTFCPPGPGDRMKLSSISLSSMAMLEVTRIMASPLARANDGIWRPSLPVVHQSDASRHLEGHHD